MTAPVAAPDEEPPAAEPAPLEAPPPEDVGEDEVARDSEAIAALEAFHWSGYIQGQWEMHEDSENELRDDGRLLNLDRFRVRRGRLKLEYRGIEHASFLMQLDATSEGLGLRDAEATVSEPFTGWNLELTVGLFKNPFGFEVRESSGNRVFPERSALARVLFPGERDVGLQLRGKQGLFNFALALMNGNPIGERAFPGRDPNEHKDFVGRLGVDTSLVDAGLSGYVGTELVAGSPAVAGKTVWFDADGDGVVDPDEVATTEASGAEESHNVLRYRLGADAQLALDLAAVGKLELLVEGALAHRAGFDGADDVDQLFGYIAVVHHICEHFGVAFRADLHDPNLDLDDDIVTTLEPVLLAYPVPAVRVSLAYDIVLEQGDSVDNNALTARMQVRF